MHNSSNDSSAKEQGGAAQRLIELLGEKNHYLEKFFELNETELFNFADGYFDNVEPFYQAREKVLDIIRCIDALVDDEVRSLADGIVPVEVRDQIEDLMRTKDQLAKQILGQDLKVLAAIENEKSNIIRELQQTKQARKAVGAYHSGQTSRQIDEKA